MTETEAALHESAHAVCAIAQGVHLAEVILEHAGRGHARFTGGLDLFEFVPTQMVVVFLAGAEAQRHFTATPDLAAATQDVESVKILLSSLDSLQDPRALDEQFQRLQQLAAVHVRENWRWIERTARELTRRRRLTHDDVLKLRGAGR